MRNCIFHFVITLVTSHRDVEAANVSRGNFCARVRFVVTIVVNIYAKYVHTFAGPSPILVAGCSLKLIKQDTLVLYSTTPVYQYLSITTNAPYNTKRKEQTSKQFLIVRLRSVSRETIPSLSHLHRQRLFPLTLLKAQNRANNHRHPLRSCTIDPGDIYSRPDPVQTLMNELRTRSNAFLRGKTS